MNGYKLHQLETPPNKTQTNLMNKLN